MGVKDRVGNELRRVFGKRVSIAIGKRKTGRDGFWGVLKQEGNVFLGQEGKGKLR